jgi:polyhydroxyalkanoate synthesis regulator phasin
MRRLIWLPIAGFLLIAGAAVAAAAPDVVRQAQAVLPAAASPDASGDPATGERAAKDGFLSEVLAELVDNGTITQEQADAIVGAIQDKAEARRTELERVRALLQTFLEDGVITQAEIDQLPADNPLRVAFDSIAEDGQISVDQLRQLHPFGPGRGHGFGRGHHGLFDGTKPAPDDSEQVPTETPGS